MTWAPTAPLVSQSLVKYCNVGSKFPYIRVGWRPSHRCIQRVAAKLATLANGFLQVEFVFSPRLAGNFKMRF